MKVSCKTILNLNCAKYFLHKIQGLTGVKKRARLSLDFSLPTSKHPNVGKGGGRWGGVPIVFLKFMHTQPTSVQIGMFS